MVRGLYQAMVRDYIKRWSGTISSDGQGTISSDGQGTISWMVKGHIMDGQGTISSDGQGTISSDGQGTIITSRSTSDYESCQIWRASGPLHGVSLVALGSNS
ncbi:hypothetical protein TNCT_332961 [Trichonephila clavata]|uniref:Uncharacterized protein n=1 Tax=Trichonephila clavata TaxID=2740835 RepID=A0A8X6HAX2_TRICU|nr:hypothetical protein TNCT_332961 [Trichonephila clavata]